MARQTYYPVSDKGQCGEIFQDDCEHQNNLTIYRNSSNVCVHALSALLHKM